MIEPKEIIMDLGNYLLTFLFLGRKIECVSSLRQRYMDKQISGQIHTEFGGYILCISKKQPFRVNQDPVIILNNRLKHDISPFSH